MTVRHVACCNGCLTGCNKNLMGKWYSISATSCTGIVSAQAERSSCSEMPGLLGGWTLQVGHQTGLTTGMATRCQAAWVAVVDIISTGLSAPEMTYYSLQVGPPPTPQPDCTCTAAGVRKRRVIEIDYLNSSNNPATLILEEGESSGPVQTYGQRVTIFGSDGNCPTGSHLLEVSIPTGGTVTKCKIPTCAATGEFWSGSFEIWQCTPTVQRNYTFTAMRLSLIDCEDVPACGGAYIYSRTFPNELMPRGKVGVPYSFTFEHGGINGAGITAGLSTPPPGLSVSSAGVISGTPTTAGTYNRQVTGVSTIGSCTIVEPYTIIIDP
jgi:hypothetical protein